MLDSDAIEKLREYKSEIVQHGPDDTLFFVTANKAQPLNFPSFEQIKLFSLTQLVNFIALTLQSLAKESKRKLVVNVEDFQTVTVGVEGFDENRKLPTIGVASFKSMFEPFPFKAQLSQEDFIINLLTKFEDSPERIELLKTASSVRAEKVSMSDDDGISQTVARKAGVHLTQNTTLKNIWNLSTYRTFPEVDQPVIPYILRLHQRDTEMPKFALYDCDGGAWKVGVTASIREWLINRLRGALVEKADLVIVL